MPVLAQTRTFDRNQILEAFLPFARPDYVEGMVLGDDLDSLLSGMYLHRRFGWKVVGVYCKYRRLWQVEPSAVFREKLLSGRYFAVDLDLYHPAIPSLGHHIIELNSGEELPGHTHSLNPNSIRGLSIHEQYTRKYPLATIHFLLWLFEEKQPSIGSQLLAWLADSAFINAQHYRDNVEDWVQRYLPLPAFQHILPALQDRAFEEFLQEKILRHLAANPLCHPNPKSSYRSKHLGLNGFQCQFDQPNAQNQSLQQLLKLLSAISAWPVLPFPAHFSGYWEGDRQDIDIQAIRQSGLPFGEWLEEKQVHSYAFTFRDRLNYTAGLF